MANNKDKNYGYNNPLQCADAIQDKSLVINAKFYNITYDNLLNGEDSPQKIFGKNSRFHFSILDGTSVLSKVKIEQIAGISKRSEYAANLQYEYELNTSNGDDNNEQNLSIAYTVKFLAGNLKGKTPAQIVLENSYDEAKKLLNEQYMYLKKNVDKYPNNQKIMDAIVDANKLNEQGLITSDNVNKTKTRTFEILKEVPKPNIYAPTVINGKELYPTHSMHIWCNIGSKYPINIEIKNYNCPIKRTDTGGVNAILSEIDKDSFKMANISLDIDTWLGIVASLERQIEMFSVMNGNKAFILANQVSEELKNNAK